MMLKKSGDEEGISHTHGVSGRVTQLDIAKLIGAGQGSDVIRANISKMKTLGPSSSMGRSSSSGISNTRNVALSLEVVETVVEKKFQKLT